MSGERPTAAEPVPWPERADSEARVSTLEVGGETLAVLSFPVDRTPLPDDLTRAQREVLELLLAGLPQREIAERRGTSYRTLAVQLRQLYGRFGVNSESELVACVLSPDATACRQKPE